MKIDVVWNQKKGARTTYLLIRCWKHQCNASSGAVSGLLCRRNQRRWRAVRAISLTHWLLKVRVLGSSKAKSNAMERMSRYIIASLRRHMDSWFNISSRFHMLLTVLRMLSVVWYMAGIWHDTIKTQLAIAYALSLLVGEPFDCLHLYYLVFTAWYPRPLPYRQVTGEKDTYH